MKTFHITETSAPESLGDRGLFKLLESVSSFSLCECRGREQIVFSGTHQVLVLDHLDEAANSAAILKQVLEVQTEIQWLIVVDQRPQIPCLPGTPWSYTAMSSRPVPWL